MKTTNAILLIFIFAFSFACKQSGSKNTSNAANQADTAAVSKETNAVLKEDTVALYAHFSHETILKNMAEAVKKMNAITANSEGNNSLQRTYSELISHDIRNRLGKKRTDNDYLLSDFINTFGKPLQSVVTANDTIDDYIESWKTVDFPLFKLKTWKQYRADKKSDYDEIIGISTATPGYGFGGIYAGVPECNKEYIGKLFAQVKSENIDKKSGYDCEDESRGDTWIITIQTEISYSEICITFNENNLVKKVRYYAPPIR